MKTLLVFIALAFAGLCFAAETSAPRVVALTGAAHPQAQIIAVDAGTGTLTFAYLKADGTRADSGNSIARITPVSPLPKTKPSDPTVYPLISDATLAAAIVAAG